MSQKKTDNLGQSKLLNEESKPIYVKENIVEYLRSRGINSRDTTQEKLGQTSLMFTNKTKNLVQDDSLETSIQYLKNKRSHI
jgi:hypothetical protein